MEFPVARVVAKGNDDKKWPRRMLFEERPGARFFYDHKGNGNKNSLRGVLFEELSGTMLVKISQGNDNKEYQEQWLKGFASSYGIKECLRAMMTWNHQVQWSQGIVRETLSRK